MDDDSFGYLVTLFLLHYSEVAMVWVGMVNVMFCDVDVDVDVEVGLCDG